MNSLEVNNFIRDITTESFKQRNSISSIGLINGKMGLCINLYEIARFTNDNNLEIMANSLIDEIFHAVKGKTSWYFENGLTGIGWGVEYLVQGKFVKGDTNDILSDVDNKIILQKVYGNNRQLDLLKGFIGFGYYFTKRLQNPNSSDDSFPILLIKQHLINLIDQFSWFSSRTPLVILEPQNITRWWPLPIIIHLLCDVYNFHIYPSKVNKLIEWLLSCIENNIIQKHYFRLLLLPNAINLLGLSHRLNDIVIPLSLKKTSRGKVLEEIKNSDAPLLNTLEVLKTYYILKKLDASQTWTTELPFWHRNVLKKIQTCMGKDRKDILEKTQYLGLLDGFNGFYTMLPVLYSKPYSARKEIQNMKDNI